MRSWTRLAGLALLVASFLPSLSHAEEQSVAAASRQPAVSTAAKDSDGDPSPARYTLKLDCNDSGTATTAYLYDSGGHLVGSTVISGLCYTGTVNL